MSGDELNPHDQVTPPSFIPEHSGHHHTTPAKQAPHTRHVDSAADASPSAPPSFTPHRSGQESGGNADESAHEPEQSVVPRRASGTSSRARITPSGTSDHHAQGSNLAATVAPGHFSRSPARPQSSMTNASQRVANHDNRNGGGSKTTARRRKPWRIAMIVLVVLLVTLLLVLVGTWRWVDSNLNRAAWLTGSADTEGTSWLILGSDERNEDGGVGGSAQDVPGARNDTILVLTRASNGSGSLISIPRDSLVKVNDRYMKINAVAEFDGPKALVGEIEALTGEHIDHVAQIRFDGLQQMVDAIGGVELCYDDDVDDPKSGMVWTKGCHQTDGTMALAFSRMRYSDPKGDFGRAERQRQVIGAIIHKTLSPAVLLNPFTLHGVAKASLESIIVDEDTNPYTLISMAFAMRAATGEDGVTGSVYWTDPDYRVQGVGSSVLLDDERNHALFRELVSGTHPAGTVGTLAETS